jgi:hypothetical protein
MNALDEIIDESIKIAKNNLDILEAIKDKAKDLMVEDLFEITKIFIKRKSSSQEGFTLEQFKTEDPEGYFKKIVKGFCVALIEISQEEVSAEEREIIFKVLDNRKKFVE